MSSRTITMSVDPKNDAEIAKAFEILSRIGAGLLMEGIETRIAAYELEDDPDEPT